MKEWIKNLLFDLVISFFPRFNKNVLGDVGVCTLLCHRDVNMFIWCLTSFFYFSGKVMSVYILDDGSLTDKDKLKLGKYFEVTIDSNRDLEKRMRKRIGGYKYLSEYRFGPSRYVFRKKYDVLLLNPFDKFIFLDADVLFFGVPTELLTWATKSMAKSCFTSHVEPPADCYGDSYEINNRVIRLLLGEKMGARVDQGFNAGFLCLPKKEINLSLLDGAIKQIYDCGLEYHRQVEETALALSIGQKMKRLPIGKYVNVWIEEEYLAVVKDRKVISVHYSGFVKDGRYKVDALKLAWRTKFFWKYNKKL